MRNTYLILSTLFLFQLMTSCSSSSDNIFNGKDLSNWKFVVEGDQHKPKDIFMVKDGMILIKGEPLGYMYTKGKYSNYTLELEYKWDGEASNSGIFVMIEKPDNPFPKGIECQLMHGHAGDFVLLGGAQMEEYKLPEGATEDIKFPIVTKKESSSEKAVGEWNHVNIDVAEGVIDVYINGVHQNHGTAAIKEGHIGLQSEGGNVLFRNIKLTKQSR